MYMEFLISSIATKAANLNTKVYLVGGSIRDLLLGKKPTDYDFAVEGNSDILAKAMSDALGSTYVVLDKETNLSRVIYKENTTLDFCSLKGATIEEDLCSRDFGINAIALCIDDIIIDSTGIVIEPQRLIDPLGGLRDLEDGLIKHIREDVFRNDPLRMLRAVRIMSQTGFIIDKDTVSLIKDNKSLIMTVSEERIINEFFHILKSNKSHQYLRFMDEELGLLEEIFTEIKAMKEIGECNYHIVNSWKHSLNALMVIEEIIYAHGYFEEHIRLEYERHSSEIVASGRTRLQLMKFGVLFHDIGKPSAMKIDETGRVRFRGHEVTGAQYIKKVSQQFKISNKETELLYKIVYNHMTPLVLYKKNDVGPKALYDFFSSMGDDTLDVLLIALADIISTRQILIPDEPMGIYKVFIEFLANNYITRYLPLRDISNILTGNDIIQNLNISEGKTLGDIIKDIKYRVFVGEVSNKKEALKYIKERYVGKES